MAVLKYKTKNGEYKTLDMIIAKSESDQEIEVLQNTGDSTTGVMSQAAVTEALTPLVSVEDVTCNFATGMSLASITTNGTTKKIHVPLASTAQRGTVILNTSTNSTSTTYAATPSAVKAAYDLAASKVSSVKINGTEKTPDSNGMVDLGTISSSSGNYLPLSGGTLTGALNLPGEQYAGSYGLNMNNSDIVKVNSIYMSDNAEGPSEGIQFVNGSTYDSIWASGGVMYFTPQMGTNRTVIHSGNIGSQSVNYATSAGTANSVAGGNVSGRPTALSSFTNDKGYITSYTDTKNTAGATNTTEKLYLIGAKSQVDYPQTYSNISCYMQSGYIYATSDETLKDFEGDIEIDLDRLKSVPKKYFRWKDNPEQLNVGTSAQKLQELYPELVTTDPNDKLGVSYAHLSVIALAAVDKLHEENLELKERVEKLEKLVESLNKE